MIPLILIVPRVIFDATHSCVWLNVSECGILCFYFMHFTNLQELFAFKYGKFANATEPRLIYRLILYSFCIMLSERCLAIPCRLKAPLKSMSSCAMDFTAYRKCLWNDLLLLKQLLFNQSIKYHLLTQMISKHTNIA